MSEFETIQSLEDSVESMTVQDAAMIAASLTLQVIPVVTGIGLWNAWQLGANARRECTLNCCWATISSLAFLRRPLSSSDSPPLVQVEQDAVGRPDVKLRILLKTHFSERRAFGIPSILPPAVSLITNAFLASRTNLDARFAKAVLNEARFVFQGMASDRSKYRQINLKISDLVPEWASVEDGFANQEVELVQPIGSSSKGSVLESDPAFGFWREWYQGFLDGKPLDWELQRRVALIDDAIWEAGPEAVAEEIERIRAKFELEKRIDALEAERDSLIAEKTRHGIGGNNPPEDMAIEPQVVKETTVIWSAIDDLREELPKDEPDTSVIRGAIEALGRGLKAILAWCGGKADLTVDQIIKWGVPLGGAAILANPKLVNDVIEAAKTWLASLLG